VASVGALQFGQVSSRRRKLQWGQVASARALGDIPRSEVMAAVGDGLPADLREVLEAIWTQHVDWLRQEDTVGAIDILSEHRVRFDPVRSELSE